MIIFDTETTGLPLADNASLLKQPKIIEFAGLQVDDSLIGIPDKDFVAQIDDYLEVIREPGSKRINGFNSIEFLCNPDQKLDEKITEITGIKDSDLEGKEPIAFHWEDLTEFFLGESFMVAHNLPFDLKMVKFEAMRLGKLLKFPWPSQHICTVESTNEITGSRMNLGGLYEHLFKEEMHGWHRAMSDVRNLARITNELVVQGYIDIGGNRS